MIQQLTFSTGLKALYAFTGKYTKTRVCISLWSHIFFLRNGSVHTHTSRTYIPVHAHIENPTLQAVDIVSAKCQRLKAKTVHSISVSDHWWPWNNGVSARKTKWISEKQRLRERVGPTGREVGEYLTIDCHNIRYSWKVLSWH